VELKQIISYLEDNNLIECPEMPMDYRKKHEEEYPFKDAEPKISDLPEKMQRFVHIKMKLVEAEGIDLGFNPVGNSLREYRSWWLSRARFDKSFAKEVDEIEKHFSEYWSDWFDWVNRKNVALRVKFQHDLVTGSYIMKDQ
jgi:hypothetical protein